jgi:hypothetical protein
MRGGLADRVSELRERAIGEAVLAQPLDHCRFGTVFAHS